MSAKIMEMTPPKLIESGEVAKPEKPARAIRKNALIGALIAAVIVCGYITLTVTLK